MGKTRTLMSWAGGTLCALAIAVAQPASAATVQIVPGTSMDMQAPDGQCVIEPSASQFDAAYFSTMTQMFTGTNNLLALFIDCNVLASMRQGIAQPITEWTIVLLPLSGGQVVPASGYTRAQVIEEMSQASAGSDMQPISTARRDRSNSGSTRRCRAGSRWDRSRALAFWRRTIRESIPA